VAPSLEKPRQHVNAKIAPRIVASNSHKRGQLFIRMHNETLSVVASAIQIVRP
jgi:hypothetical protein